MSSKIIKKIELEKSGLYIDIAFNENNGGLKATHINHTFDAKKVGMRKGYKKWVIIMDMKSYWRMNVTTF